MEQNKKPVLVDGPRIRRVGDGGICPNCKLPLVRHGFTCPEGDSKESEGMPKVREYGRALIGQRLEMDKKDERITELEAALEKYGRHEPSCDMVRFFATDSRVWDKPGNRKECTCGLDQALKGE